MHPLAKKFEHFRFSVAEGNYNLFNPSEKTCRVFVQWGKGKDEMVNFHLEEDAYTFDPSEMPAYQLYEMAQLYLQSGVYSSTNPKVEALLEWFDGLYHEEEHVSNQDVFDWVWVQKNFLWISKDHYRRAKALELKRSFAVSFGDFLSSLDAE